MLENRQTYFLTIGKACKTIYSDPSQALKEKALIALSSQRTGRDLNFCVLGTPASSGIGGRIGSGFARSLKPVWWGDYSLSGGGDFSLSGGGDFSLSGGLTLG